MFVGGTRIFLSTQRAKKQNSFFGQDFRILCLQTAAVCAPQVSPRVRAQKKSASANNVLLIIPRGQKMSKWHLINLCISLFRILPWQSNFFFAFCPWEVGQEAKGSWRLKFLCGWRLEEKFNLIEAGGSRSPPPTPLFFWREPGENEKPLHLVLAWWQEDICRLHSSHNLWHAGATSHEQCRAQCPSRPRQDDVFHQFLLTNPI